MSKSLDSLFMILRRGYTVAAEKVGGQATASNTRKVAADSGKEAFWMRDPKTGNWMPENHFKEVDVVELRDKFLPKRLRFL